MNLYTWAEQQNLSGKLINAALQKAGLSQSLGDDARQEIYMIWLRKKVAAGLDYGQVANYAYRIAFTAARKMRYAMANAVSLPDSAFRAGRTCPGSYSLQDAPAEADMHEDRHSVSDATLYHCADVYSEPEPEPEIEFELSPADFAHLPLTDTDRAIMQFTTQRLATWEIAARLGVQDATVRRRAMYIRQVIAESGSNCARAH